MQSRILFRAAVLLVSAVLWLGLPGCGDDSDDCPTCPRPGAQTFVLRPDGSGDRPTIQAAVDDAVRGDVILLENGIYRGDGNWDVVVEDKGLIFLSRFGDPDSCIIDCEDPGSEGHRGLQILYSAEGVWVDGIGFRNSESVTGGGIHCHESVLRLINCSFQSNSADRGGGLASINSEVRMEGCGFDSNSAASGGGVWAESGWLHARQCTFTGNASQGVAGGLGGDRADLVLLDCSFDQNSAVTSGGGLFAFYGSLRASRLDCRGNEAGQQGGGVMLEDTEAATITSSRLAFNRALSGAAVYCAGRLFLDHCTVVSNVAEEYGSVALAGGGLTAVSCTIADNSSTAAGAAVVLSGETSAVFERTILAFNQNSIPVLCLGDGPVILSCCDVYGNPQGDYEGCITGQQGLRGNISEDPLFCGATDYRLEPESPCADAACGRMGAHAVGCR